MQECKIKIRTEEEKNKLMTRMNIIIGQMNGIKKMIDENRYCEDILIQLLSIEKSIKSIANVILDDHLHSCFVEGIKNGDMTVVDEIMELVKRFQ